jgi:hypothetical protein
MKLFKNKKNKELNINYEDEKSFLKSFDLAKNNIPQWYRAISPANPDIRRFPIKLNIKNCLPFLDSFTAGYMYTLPFDIAVEILGNGQPNITWASGDFDIIKTRNGSESPGMPTPEGYHDTNFVWQTKTAIKLPKGYSALLTHPLNRFDLPFMTLSAIVDADYGLNGGHIPFYIKKGFEGIIEQGTPFIQILPFKRENWKSVKVEGLFKKTLEDSFVSTLNAGGWYKKNSWKRKYYN